ncbi:malonyl-CoA decarboxylase [Pseudorhodoferax sp. Leaf274]|uniref:malonyl-CoA decarboxylase n=1 Tax=Pseudorhodoferax sp. Leaf274 TaxID=1736318 RepID=UPI000702D951|nr:malonyl-CoA decarboxylase [Pseudorhodoferax sp. Leaf274]KQP44601.1 malonyl-CoA decarboxylase [Pseudorhodoferax sp. Leaf274]
MNATDWIARSLALLKPAAKPPNAKPDAPRPMAERLRATLRRDPEALTPSALRRLLAQLQAVVDPHVSEAEAGRRAQQVTAWYAGAQPAERRDLWLLLVEQFSPDADEVRAARDHYDAVHGTPEQAAAEIRLRSVFVSPRTRMLQRFAVDPQGLRFLVDLRAELLPHLKAERRLQPLDAELAALFSTWFDLPFLELRRISWDSPASLIEKLIRYEAVHDIRSWADVKNRLDSDRRCYGFFHPRLPNEPLIFVEVALIDHLAGGIGPLLDEQAAVHDIGKATTAVFYSISNTQAGLRGVSFGDSLIKRVVETLREEFPKLKQFATLSPIPGFRAWLAKNADGMLQRLPDKARAELGRALGAKAPEAEHVMAATERVLALDEKSAARQFLLRCAAEYLCRELDQGRPLDPVARFHLGNGARVERLNWAGDPSPKGLKQSCGLMVNYLYDLRRLDKHRAMTVAGNIPLSSEVERLLI